MSFVSIFTQEFNNLIKVNVVDQLFPNIQPNEQLLLLQCTIGLLKIMFVYIDSSIAYNLFLEKLQQNDYEDVKWLLTILLPYINTIYKPLSDIKTLNDIYTAKLENDDINYTSPVYVYSNLEYNRCLIGNSNKELTFSPDHIIQHYYLLMNTIVRCFNRLHPNWINIIPMRLDTFHSTKLYADTKDKVDNKNVSNFNPVVDFPFSSAFDNSVFINAQEKIKGLHVADLYNTMSMHIFDNIVPYKWLLYYIGCKFNSKKLIIPSILFLNAYFDGAIMDAFVQNLNWEKITTKIQTSFGEQWHELINVVHQNEQIGMQRINNDFILIDPHYVQTFVLSIVKFYDNKYANLVVDKTYVKLKKDPNNPKEKPSKESIIASAKSINIMYLYRFLQKSINEFKFTWFALKLMNKEKTKFIEINENNAYYAIIQGTHITYKNIYNFCKSFVHHVDNNKNYIRYPKHWESLNSNAKTEILDRFNTKITDWFVIKKNIIALSNYLDYISPNIATINKRIHTFLLNSVVDITFETLITTGTLTYMVPNNELTNKKLYDVVDNNQKQQVVNKISHMYFLTNDKHMKNAYYYMTSKPFGSTPRYSFAKSSKIYGYAEIASDPDYAWYINTAYNWVSQINFCHKFLNNRVTFVTGGTGAGKSTQVPKLYCYFSVALDYKLNPNVLITCPRVNLVKKNSERVSYELALPFKTSTGDDTENYQVQFKHMNEKRTKQDNTPKLIFVTDGTLVQEIKNPLLKKITTEKLFHLENLYDTIIVDEAHEHNVNMDMILTFMRHITFYNNELRLVIMSATIDQDEHIYRRYFRKINDNLKYPLNTWIEEHKLDRINIDRRFDIQPPTKTTTMPKIIEKTELKLSPEEVIQQIATQYKGNVLLFQSGRADIDKSLQILNKPGYLPEDTLAIPYYAAMEKSRFPGNMEFAQKIDDRITDIRINKTQSFVDSDLLDGTSMYTRYVVVSTNIAESGVTYKYLDWVVDTGKEKILEYDVEKRQSMLKQHFITQQSRMQRRGRVGRTRAGTIYYMYDPTKLEKTKLYAISTSDIKFSVLFEFLKAPNDASIFTKTFEDIVNGNVTSSDVYYAFFSSFLKKYDSTVSNTFIQDTATFMQKHDNDIKAKFKKLLDDHVKKSNVSNAIADNMKQIVNMWFYLKNNYFINEQLYTYKGESITQINKYFCDFFYSGVDVQCLTDETGDFYLIHPDELRIKRNETGDIIENKHISKIKSEKIQFFINELFRQSYIAVDQNGQIVKTAIGQFVNKVVIKFSEYIEPNYAYAMGICFLLLDNNNSNDNVYINDLLNLIALLTITNSNPLLLSEPTHAQPMTEKERAFYLRKHFKEFTACIQSENQDDIDLYVNFGRLIDNLIKGRDDGHVSYIEYIAANKHHPNIQYLLSRITDDLSEESEEVRNTNYLEIIKEMHVPYMYTRLKQHIKVIDTFHTSIDNLHPNKGNNYLKLREQMRFSYYTILRTDIELFTEAHEKMKIYRQYIDKLCIDPIKGAFLFNRPDAICKRISTTPFYVPILYPKFETICKMEQTALSSLYTGDYIMYLHRDENNKVRVIMKVNKYFLEAIANVYKEYKIVPINYDSLPAEQMRIVMAYFTTLQHIHEDMKVALVHTDIFHVLNKLKN